MKQNAGEKKDKLKLIEKVSIGLDHVHTDIDRGRLKDSYLYKKLMILLEKVSKNIDELY